MNSPTAPILGISWWHVIMDLERHGYSCRAIGAAIGRAQATVDGWKNLGAEPKHVDGENLLQLWSHVTGKADADLPRKVDTSFSAAVMR